MSVCYVFVIFLIPRRRSREQHLVLFIRVNRKVEYIIVFAGAETANGEHIGPLPAVLVVELAGAVSA